MTTKNYTVAEIKKLLKQENLIIGTERTLKQMKLGNVETVLLSTNCPQKVIDDIDYYAKLSDIEKVELNYPNDELGVICKKPFSISVLSLLKVESK